MSKVMRAALSFRLYHAQGKDDKAESFYKRALAIHEKVYGQNHPTLVPIRVNLAQLYYDRGQYDKAELQLQRSLAILTKNLGPYHFDVAMTLTMLAGQYKSRGQYKKAEPLYKRGKPASSCVP